MGCNCNNVNLAGPTRITLLKDEHNGLTIFPVTTAEAVLTEDGTLLDTIKLQYNNYEYHTLYKHIVDLENRLEKIEARLCTVIDDYDDRLKSILIRLGKLEETITTEELSTTDEPTTDNPTEIDE